MLANGEQLQPAIPQFAYMWIADSLRGNLSLWTLCQWQQVQRVQATIHVPALPPWPWHWHLDRLVATCHASLGPLMLDWL